MQVSKSKTVAKAIAYILVILIIFATVGLVYRFTNGFNEDFKTFYIEHNGKQILTTNSKMTLNEGETYRFDVKYTFDGSKSEPKDYHVKVVPNVEKDFDFTVDGERYLYSKEKDLTAGFGLKKSDTYFELTLKEKMNLQSVLSSVYEGKTVEVSQEAEMSNQYPFMLVVSSYNDNVTYNIRFNFHISVTGIELSKTEIIFSSDEQTTEPDTPVTPEEQGKYFIEYDTLGNGSVLSVDFQCQARANAGDRVEFTVELVDLSDQFEDYYPVEITNIRIYDCDTGDEFDQPDYSNGVYSFTMPDCNVTVMIYLMRI